MISIWVGCFGRWGRYFANISSNQYVILFDSRCVVHIHLALTQILAYFFRSWCHNCDFTGWSRCGKGSVGMCVIFHSSHLCRGGGEVGEWGVRWGGGVGGEGWSYLLNVSSNLYSVFVFFPRPFWPTGIVIVIACVCVCVYLCVCQLFLVRAITHHTFQLKSPA